MRISDWSSDVCSSDLLQGGAVLGAVAILQVDEAETGQGQEGRQRGKARALRRADLAIAAVPGDADQRQILALAIARAQRGNARLVDAPRPGAGALPGAVAGHGGTVDPATQHAKGGFAR